MARSVSIRHPADICNDERVAALIGNHGATGYGVYWIVIEMLYRQESMRIEYCDKMLQRMSARTGLKHADFVQLMNNLIRLYDLFAVEDGYLVSTIIYRKPKKPRQASVTEPECCPTGSTTLPQRSQPSHASRGDQMAAAETRTGMQEVREHGQSSDERTKSVSTDRRALPATQFSDA